MCYLPSRELDDNRCWLRYRPKLYFDGVAIRPGPPSDRIPALGPNGRVAIPIVADVAQQSVPSARISNDQRSRLTSCRKPVISENRRFLQTFRL